MNAEKQMPGVGDVVEFRSDRQVEQGPCTGVVEEVDGNRVRVVDQWIDWTDVSIREKTTVGDSDRPLWLLDDVGAAVEALNEALAVVETNEPINRAEGNVEQADLEKENAASFKEALKVLEEHQAEGEAPGSAALDDANSGMAAVLTRLKLTQELARIRVEIGELGQTAPEAMKRLKLAAMANQIRIQLGGANARAVESQGEPVQVPEGGQDISALEGAGGNVGDAHTVQDENLSAKDESASPVEPEERPVDGDSVGTPSPFGLRSSGKKTRENINRQVADIVGQIQAGKDPVTLTPDEIALLKQYSGKGGLTDNSQYEYYTPTPVAEGVWGILAANGYLNGNVLEPATGAGVFSATKPAGTVITGTEIDGVAATVNQVLHPEDKILNQSFEKLAVSARDNTFDAVVGNVPFGDARGASALDDPEHKGEKRIERYFIDRVIDKTRPGGLITLVVPTQVVGNATGSWKAWRAKISRKAEFLGAHKLPSKTFGRQGTDVVTDIIVLRKHPADLLDKIGGLSSDTLAATKVLWAEFIDGEYWLGEGKPYIHGRYVPPDATKARSMEQVIADDGMTPEALKSKLAAHFESRIDWAALDSAEPVINYYQAGDRRVINGKECEFDGAHWAEVSYATNPNDTAIDADKFGAASVEALGDMLANPESMLGLTSAQAFAAYKRFPNLFNAQQRMAVEFSIGQPLDQFREQAYRGSLLGSMVTQYIARANVGNADSAERERIAGLIRREFEDYGHPRSLKGFVLDGEMARHFGAYLGAIDEQGNLSDALSNGIEQAKGYDSANVLSVAEHLIRKGGIDLALDDIKTLYDGPRTIETLGDIADVDGLAITADGAISTNGRYCCGEIYLKCADLQNAMAGESDARVKDKLQKQIDLMLSKAKKTAIEDISFGLRDKWLDRRYQLEFLHQNGYPGFRYEVVNEVEKTSETTGGTYTGYEREADTTNPNGQWRNANKPRSDFERQLAEYMNGKSIGHNVREKGGVSAAERTDRFREQVNALEEQFKFFMQSHGDFADIERAYNVTFNSYVKPDYDDSDLGLEGLSGQIKLHPYQNQAVRQFSDDGTGILGFDVGLGKSFTALAYSAYDRQMGRSNKHCIVVPKSVLANWYMESKRLYGDHDNMLLVGFEPKRDKNDVIQREAVLDENGQPKVNSFTGEIEYQDVLVEDTPEVVYEKMHQIPHATAAVVVMTHEKFAMIPMREESRLKYAQGWADKSMMSQAELRKLAGGADKEGKSYAEAKAEERAQNQFADDGTRKKDELPYFEDMGFDRVIVDEFHFFKNSFGVGEDAAKLAYLPNPASSQRARDMAMKAAWLRGKYNGKGVVGLTATPVANSPIEIFNMLSLVIDQGEFERLGIYTPDDFVRQFGIIQQVEKLRVSGELVTTEGLAGFKNLNALRGLFHRYANMKNAGDVDPEGNTLKLPEAVEMMDVSDMDDEQADLYAMLREQAKKSRDPAAVKAGTARPMFAVIRDMDRVTTDVDLYHKTITFLFKSGDEDKVKALLADLPASIKIKLLDEESGEKAEFAIEKTADYRIAGDTLTYVAPEQYEEAVVSRLPKFGIDYVNHPLRPKYAKLIANMQAELDSKGKQLVFTEEKSQHGKLLRLIVNHLPVTAEQAAIINADTAGGEKLQQISDAYNRGDVRIIIANKKAEVGVNLQKGTSAIHHMTLPWNPASIQQRNGRGVRQGNNASRVRVYYYQARGSFDEYRLDLLKNKGNWIASLMDRRNDADTAENAQAMGAFEQAALLADNREEFLAMVAEQRAKKEAEEKQKRDTAARVKLNQLASVSLTLERWEGDKAKAVQDAQAAIEKAQAAYDKAAESEGPDSDAAQKKALTLAAAKARAGKVDEVWNKKRDDAESMKRQIGAFLRGQAAKGALPFDAAVLDKPTGVLLTKERLLVREGGVYKTQPKQSWEKAAIVRVLAVNFSAREVQLESIVGGSFRAGADYAADVVFAGAVEVNAAPDELERMKWLATPKTYRQLGEVDKEFFLAHRAEISLGGYSLAQDADSYAIQYAGTGEKVVYPDKQDKAVLDWLTSQYKAVLVGSTERHSSERELGDIMPAFFGDDWREVVKSTMSTARPEEIRAQAAVFIAGEVAKLPMATAQEAGAAIEAMKGRWYGDDSSVDAAVKRAVQAWMVEHDYVNVSEAMAEAARAIDAQAESMRERKRQLADEEQRAAGEALKADPNYREVPADMAAKFQALGVTVWYNTEPVETDGGGRFKNETIEPFSALWMKDKNGYNGVVARTKEILKSRYHAKFCTGVVRGDSKHADSTWRVPAGTKLDELYELLS